MPVERKFAIAQIARMDTLPKFPFSREGKTELVDTLQRWCEGDAHAKATVDDILESATRSPSCVQIRDTAYRLRKGRTGPSRECGLCSGSGWKQVMVDGLPYAERCLCPGGENAVAPSLACQSCGDMGYVAVRGTYVRCSCQFGSQLEEKVLRLVNRAGDAKRMPAAGRPVLAKPITEADVEAARQQLVKR